MSQPFAGHGSTVGVGVGVFVGVGVGSSVGVAVAVGFASSVNADVGVAFVSFFFVSFSVPQAVIVTTIARISNKDSSFFPLFTVTPPYIARSNGLTSHTKEVYRAKATKH